MRFLAAVSTALCLALVAAACDEVERPDVTVTPGTVPPAIAEAAWQEVPISYCIADRPEQGFVDHQTLVRLTQQAFESWGVPFRFEGACENGIEDGNNRNEIGWGNLSVQGRAVHQAGETSLRFRRPLLGGGNSEIVEADIVLDLDPLPGLATSECLLTTLLHETGHFLGVQHVENGDAVMASTLSSCPQELTEADLQLVRQLYGELQ